MSIRSNTLAHARAHHYRFRIGAMCGLNREKRQVYVEATPDDGGRELIPRRVLGYDTLDDRSRQHGQ